MVSKERKWIKRQTKITNSLPFVSRRGKNTFSKWKKGIIPPQLHFLLEHEILWKKVHPIVIFLHLSIYYFPLYFSIYHFAWRWWKPNWSDRLKCELIAVTKHWINPIWVAQLIFVEWWAYIPYYWANQYIFWTQLHIYYFRKNSPLFRNPSVEEERAVLILTSSCANEGSISLSCTAHTQELSCCSSLNVDLWFIFHLIVQHSQSDDWMPEEAGNRRWP